MVPLILAFVAIITLTGTAGARAQGPAMELGELELLWEAGGPPPQKLGTTTMAIHPITGDLWVAVAHDNQFWTMSQDGEYKEVDSSGQIVRGWSGGGDRLLLSPDGGALYVARGVSLPQAERWPFIRKYALSDAVVAGAAETATTGTIDGTFSVDGHDLYLRCEGTGSPTVVYMHGAIPSREAVPMPHANGLFAMDALADEVRVCVFDRRNVGRSETVDAPQSPDDVLADMRGLLGAAGVQPPYVLLGASFGGLLAYLYANQHPDEVVGMVLLDSMFPDEMALEDMFPYEVRYEASDVEDETEGFERISHYKVMQAAQPYIGREPAIPVTFLNSIQEGHDVNDFGMPEYDERVIELQQAYVERFSPGRYLRVDSPHFMEAAIPDLIVEELRGVIEAAGD